jgi:hypothetical protein
MLEEFRPQGIKAFLFPVLYISTCFCSWIRVILNPLLGVHLTHFNSCLDGESLPFEPDAGYAAVGKQPGLLPMFSPRGAPNECHRQKPY